MPRPGNEGGGPGNSPPSLFIPDMPDVASAAALGVSGSGNYLVTGTVTITSLPSLSVGTAVVLRFAAALTLTYNATSLILQGSANLTTAAGDVVALRSEGGGNWRELWRRLAAAASAGAVTRVGGNTTEATTTSTTAVDLLSIAALSITAATPIEFIVSGRKTTGAANRGGLGLKLNTTVIGEASATADNIYRQSTTNQAESGAATGLIQSRVTSYLRAATGQYSDYGTGAAVTAIANANETADSPTANITDFVIRGIIADALITLGADELQLYSLSTS